MIQIKNIQTIQGVPTSLSLASEQQITLDATHLLLLPGLIDPHVHFRTPGWEYKEDWRTAAQASVKGGYTTVFDMPNTQPPTVTQQALIEKKRRIDSQLREINIPLRYQLFFGADKQQLNEIKKVRGQVVGIKVFMGSSTGGLLIDDDVTLNTIFKLAFEEDMLVAVHAEDEQRLREKAKQLAFPASYELHSCWRDETVATLAVEKALNLVREHGTRLYILHTSTRDEMDLIATAKAEGLPVFAETSPHHLFLTTADYPRLQGKAVMNPPLRAKSHQKALFDAINEGIIDTIGSDHAPHTLVEKAQSYGACPCGVPGIETTLPLLLEAYHQALLSLETIVKLTSARAQAIFGLEQHNDYVLVDLNKRAKVDEAQLKTKCRWSPFAGWELRGWPAYTLLANRLYDLSLI